MSESLPDRVWEPPRLARASVAVVTLAAVLLLLGRLGVRQVVPTALLGAGCGAVGLWLLQRDRYRPAAVALGTLLFVPVGLAIGTAVLQTALGAADSLFTTTTLEALTLAVVRLALVLGVVVACTTALFGSLATGTTLAPANVSCGVRTVVKLGIPSAVYATAAAGLAVLSDPSAGPTIDVVRVVADGVAVAVTVLLSPPSPAADVTGAAGLAADYAVGTFALLSLGGLFGARSLLRRLPVADLLAVTSEIDDDRASQAVARTVSTLSTVALLAFVPAVFAFVVDVVVGPAVFVSTIGPTPAGLLFGLVSANLLRWLAVATMAGALFTVILLTQLRRLVRQSTAETVVPLLPWLVGLGVTAVTIAVASDVVSRAVERIAGQLGRFSGQFEQIADGVVSFYGPSTLLTGLFVATLFVTLALLVGLSLLFRFGIVSQSQPGTTLAGGGLFVAAGLAAGRSASLGVVATTLVAALLVSDIGRDGRTLGRELGRYAGTVQVQTLRVGFLAVAGLGALAVTLGVRRVALDGFATNLPATLPLAVTVGCCAALVLVLWR